MKLKLPKSWSLARYSYPKTFFSGSLMAAWSLMTISPLASLGIFYVIINDTYKDNIATTIDHYIGGGLFVASLIYVLWWKILLIPISITLITLIFKRSHILLALEGSLYITTIIWKII